MSGAVEALLATPGLRSVLEAIGRDGDEVWLVGGCVRNVLLGEPVGDVDIATQAEPETVRARAEEAGLHAVPTGIEHGTLTVIKDGVPFEVTTLRRDVETDGRRAVVAFSRDLADDAARRDFTMNALYVSRDGTVIDPIGGRPDLEARRVRFIGDASARIGEDYLRILRFFRFYAWYGHGAPDRDAMRAITGLRDGLDTLSAERVWSELKKLLAAPQAARSLLWMRQCGVYQRVLPESGDMDGFVRFLRLEQAAGLIADPLLRLMALLPLTGPDRMAALARRLKLSNAEAGRLAAARGAYGDVQPLSVADPKGLRLALYEHGEQAIKDAWTLRAAHELDADPQAPLPPGAGDALAALWTFASQFEKPRLPVSGQDLVARGIPAGPQVGAALKLLEAAWMQSDFQLGRDALLGVLKG